MYSRPDWNERAIKFYDRLGAKQNPIWLRYALDETEIRRLAGG